MVGLAALQERCWKSCSARSAPQPLASQIYGLYTGLVYLTPIFGGMLADRVLGQRRTVILGAALMAIGHFMMAFEPLFLFALAVLILGNGAFKPNISTQVGALYAPGDRRRDRAFSIFYVGINLGAFLAPLVCGTLGEELGWHYGFAAAGVGMTARPRRSISSPRRRCRRTPCASARARGDSRSIARRLARDRRAARCCSLPVSLFWATYEQQGNTIALWADDYTDRRICVLAREIPVTWFQAFNPFMIFAFTPFIVALWRRQGAARAVDRGQDGDRLLAQRRVAYLMHGRRRAGSPAAARRAGSGCSPISSCITVGELYLSPTSLSLVTKVAPARVLSMMMGVWLATSFVGGFLAGYLGTFWSSMSKPAFFLMLAVIAAARRPGHRLLSRPLRAARLLTNAIQIAAAARHIARPATVAAASDEVTR